MKVFVKVTVNAMVKEHTDALRIHRLSRNIRTPLKMLSHLFLDFTTDGGVFCGMLLRCLALFIYRCVSVRWIYGRHVVTYWHSRDVR